MVGAPTFPSRCYKHRGKLYLPCSGYKNGKISCTLCCLTFLYLSKIFCVQVRRWPWLPFNMLCMQIYLPYMHIRAILFCAKQKQLLYNTYLISLLGDIFYTFLFTRYKSLKLNLNGNQKTSTSAALKL